MIEEFIVNETAHTPHAEYLRKYRYRDLRTSLPLASLCIFMGRLGRCGLTTMNVQRIESTTLASSVPILLAHSVGICLRRKVRRHENY